MPKTAIQQAAPILAAIKDGFLFGMHKAGEPLPELPDAVRMIGVDDRQGRGPLIFDANQLFDVVDSVIVDCQNGDLQVNTPAMLADKARAGERTLFVQTTTDAGK